VQVIFYKEDDGTVPMVEWIERLRVFGYELHRPYADTLRDGIHELRFRFQRVNYRMLYFFHGSSAVIFTHGLTKEKNVSNSEIDRALDLKKRFEADPGAHTFFWEQ
jgi:hypothetical protein